MERKIRVMCAREIQNSIEESVHQELSTQIELLGISAFYDIQKYSIKCNLTGSEFFFTGLKHKIDSIKSIASVDICWVEEAHIVSRTSWDKLTPTIRKPGSEIWITFNPELETDETYQRFVLHPPENAWVQKVSYKDNPWVSTETRGEIRDTRLRSQDDYLNIWLGHTKQTLEGAVYARELREATEEGRITKVPYDHAHPVNTYWDLGYHDMTAIWFIQKVGFTYRVIDYHEDRQKLLPHYVNVLQEKKYNYGIDYLPHDAASHQGVENTVAHRLEVLTGRKPIVVARDNAQNGIDALRTVFPQMWFDETRCADGINALRHYRYDIDDKTKQFSKIPLHDWSSHGADALRAFAMSDRAPRERPNIKLAQPRATLHFLPGRAAGQSWMGR